MGSFSFSTGEDDAKQLPQPDRPQLPQPDLEAVKEAANQVIAETETKTYGNPESVEPQSQPPQDEPENEEVDDWLPKDGSPSADDVLGIAGFGGNF